MSVAASVFFFSATKKKNNAPPRSSPACDALPAGDRWLCLFSRRSGRGGVDKFIFLVFQQLRVDLHRRHSLLVLGG